MSKADAGGVSSLIDGLKALSAEELGEVIAAAQREREVKIELARQKLKSEFEQRAAKLNLSVADIMREPEQAKKKIAPRYRGPDGQEWSGRGQLPNWLKEAEKSGRNRADFKI